MYFYLVVFMKDGGFFRIDYHEFDETIKEFKSEIDFIEVRCE